MRGIREETSQEPVWQSPMSRSEGRIETGGPQNCHQSNLYNFGSNELGNHLCRNRPEGTPCRMLHMSKLKEVLGDSGLPTSGHPDSDDHQDRISVQSSKTKSDDLE